MTARLPSMPFFVSDYLSSGAVKMMSLAERGLYCQLLFNQWQEGRLPNNPEKLARICDCSREEFLALWPGISERFTEDSKGNFYNRKLEGVRKEYISKRKRQSAAATNAAKTRWETNAKRNAKRNAIPMHPIQSNPILTKPIKQEEEKRENTRALGEFGRCILTEAQEGKLRQRLDNQFDLYVERFDRWVNEQPEAKAGGVKRKHRHAYESILAWFDKDGGGRNEQNRGESAEQQKQRRSIEAARRVIGSRTAEVGGGLPGRTE